MTRRRLIPPSLLSTSKAVPLVLGAVVLVRNTYFNGWDFEVFWRAASDVWRGISPYGLDPASGMVFKYPPWLVSVLWPLGWGSLLTAKGIWGGIQAATWLHALYWLRKNGVQLGAVVVAGVGYWVVFAYHALAGQITGLILTSALIVYPFVSPWKNAVWIFLASAKVFTLLPMVGIRSLWVSGRCWVLVGIGAVLSTVFLSGWVNEHPWTLLDQWVRAARSGADLGLEVIRGRRNQGLPALWMRTLGIGVSDPWMELGVTLAVLGCTTAVFWSVQRRLQARLSLLERWVSWVGLSVVVQPLAWAHSFVLAFPLAAVSVDRAWSIRSRSLGPLVLACLGIVMTCWVSSQALDTGWIRALEWLSVKSWGVCLSCVALGWAKSMHPMRPKSQ